MIKKLFTASLLLTTLSISTLSAQNSTPVNNESFLKNQISNIEIKLICEDLEIKAIRGLEGIKVGEVKIGGKVLRACVASGLGNAQKVLEQIKSGEEHYDVIEIMACPGGCVNGGGQPIQPKKLSNTLVKARQQALYNEDRRKLRRISAENKSIIKLYDEYLEEFGSHKAHELLHTTFASRKR